MTPQHAQRSASKCDRDGKCANDVRDEQLGRQMLVPLCRVAQRGSQDRKSTRLNSSHSQISYAVFCLKKKTKRNIFVGEAAIFIARAFDQFGRTLSGVAFDFEMNDECVAVGESVLIE